MTNFDTAHACTIIEHGIAIVSNQVQYSLIDLRLDRQRVSLCQEHNMHLLADGTLCGGLLSHAYLDQPEPGGAALPTATLGKYKQMVDAWGGWELLQSLLSILQQIADKHGVSIANVTVRYILDCPMVAGIIVGVRLGINDHCMEHARVFDLRLDAADRDQIQTVLEKSRGLYQGIGDCGDEYRR
ncbi:hypothetical protein NKDENANG_01196 [Candidatus Entotheonellaceae bacterium PAL068K]